MSDKHKSYTPALLNAYCLQPMEIKLAKMTIDRSGEQPEIKDLSQEAEAMPGADLLLSLIAVRNGYVMPVDIDFAMTRDMLEKLYDGLGRFLQDGGHYHWSHHSGTVDREKDAHVSVNEDDLSFTVPDTLDGLE